MIIVQDIVVEWGKGWRGAPGAAQRNAVPESLPLPAMPPRVLPKNIIYHSAQFAYEFSSPWETLNLKGWDQGRCVIGPIWITPEAETYQVMFDGLNMGAPIRDELLPKTLFTLAIGQWGRVVYNGRFGGGFESGWTYQKRVLNIGSFAETSSDLFTHGEPDYRYRNMAKLW